MIYLLSIFLFLFSCQKKEDHKMNEEESFTSQRHLMVESQIKSRGVALMIHYRLGRLKQYRSPILWLI